LARLFNNSLYAVVLDWYSRPSRIIGRGRRKPERAAHQGKDARIDPVGLGQASGGADELAGLGAG
jgi:hypothetical protein